MTYCGPRDPAAIVPKRPASFEWGLKRMKGGMATVDVIVPCYNYGCFLRECVESVLTQSLRTVRVLIIDDASADTTPIVANELALEDPRVSFVRHPENRGHIATYNEGIAWASAEYLLLLSADDLLLPGALARAAALMDAHPEIGFTFGRCMQLYPGDPPPSPKRDHGDGGWRILDGTEFIGMNGARNDVATATAVVRTSLQKRLGGYHPDLPHAGDMEMWLRLALHGSVGFIDAEQAVYRRHERNMSLAFNGRLVDLQQRKAALDRALGSLPQGRYDDARWHEGLLESFASDAVSLASEAFNRGETTECERILDFAAEMWPDIRNARQWGRVSWKRRFGPKLWSAIHPVVLELRRLGKAG
jgi:glycosyltransferase involved in cell wall biosynthesis